MATNIMVRPPRVPSSGATTLRRSLGLRGKLLRRDDMTPIPQQYKYVINWGNSNAFASQTRTVFNRPQNIGSATNKHTAFVLLQMGGVRVPQFQTDAPVDARATWLARTNLHGSGGDGIVVIRRGQAFPRAPLYVKYVAKLREFRIHVAFGNVLLIQEKKRQRDNEQTEDQKLIRNHDNGWVFCVQDIAIADAVRADIVRQATEAVRVLGLDFGAVDLVLGKEDNLAYVLEVNTAPGLESPTLIDAYTQAFLAQCPDTPRIVRPKPVPIAKKKVLKKPARRMYAR